MQEVAVIDVVVNSQIILCSQENGGRADEKSIVISPLLNCLARRSFVRHSRLPNEAWMFGGHFPLVPYWCPVFAPWGNQPSRRESSQDDPVTFSSLLSTLWQFPSFPPYYPFHLRGMPLVSGWPSADQNRLWSFHLGNWLNQLASDFPLRGFWFVPCSDYCSLIPMRPFTRSFWS